MTDTRHTDATPSGTETRSDTGPASTENRTMADVDHTHPYGDSSLRELFRRGETIATDGGERDAAAGERTGPDDGDDEESDRPGRDDRRAGNDAADPDEMRDVDHTPPTESDDANRVFERGGEHEPAREPDDGERDGRADETDGTDGNADVQTGETDEGDEDAADDE